MNCGRGPAATVRCRHCPANITAAPGARAVQCMQCTRVTRVPGCGRPRPGMPLVPRLQPSPSFGGGCGKKRAVLIGIKYAGRCGSELKGPINDVKCMRYLLTERFGFPNDCVLILTDEETNKCRLPTNAAILPRFKMRISCIPGAVDSIDYGRGGKSMDETHGRGKRIHEIRCFSIVAEHNLMDLDLWMRLQNESCIFGLPTKNNIRMAMHWLVQGCSSGDSLVFQFSGMGAQVPDDDGDECDGMDEAICPMDSFHQGPILDDEINEAIVRPLVQGVKLHAIVDACHSATVLDLPYQCVMSKTTGCLTWADQRTTAGACKGTSGGKAVLISGSSNGKSRPTNMLPEPCATIGAMTHSFIKALECEPRTTYGRLLSSMKNTMRQGGACNLQGPVGSSIRKVANFSGVEEPHMSSAERFDIDRTPFCM